MKKEPKKSAWFYVRTIIEIFFKWLTISIGVVAVCCTLFAGAGVASESYRIVQTEKIAKMKTPVCPVQIVCPAVIVCEKCPEIPQMATSTVGNDLIIVEKPKDTDFESYKDWFKYYQKIFGLLEYKITFDNKELENACANIYPRIWNKTAHTNLNYISGRNKRGCAGVKKIARHEVIHLLIRHYENDEEKFTQKLTDLLIKN